MTGQQFDVIVVGGGTAGAFAAATVAREGLDVVLLERKSEAEAGHIACGDAIKGASTFPDVIDRERLRAESFTNEEIQRALFELPGGEQIEYSFGDQSGAILDRKRYGEVLLEEADRAGATIHYDTLVQDVIQNEGVVEGVVATRNGSQRRYEAPVTIDAAGALSILQDKADLSDATFDTNVDYTHFCSAYREILHVDEPVEYDDALVFKPTEELGYLWYFPRTGTEINVGLGFQMTEEPMQLVEALRQDLLTRPEFETATVEDKFGAALPTRRPYDSAVAPGFLAAGDAAAHVNPTTGGGIPGAAKAGHWAGEIAIDAVIEESVGEEALWAYNHRIQADFGKRFAAMDLYNIFGTAHSIDELTDVVASLPAQQLIDVLGKEGTASMDLLGKVKLALSTFGHWRTLYDAYQVNAMADELKSIYDEFPSTPAGFERWQRDRDQFMDRFYDQVGAEPKY
ncbi:geranylgeranyl reductase family protein [Halapricum hydrolyticum]|uniref:Geranylgeranyl reductase family protein n=1 Tax=Halapricum hydrolyticum TaxID=2979991 RepID=A0AAE3IC65_9EURY|nr:geranylgeranyl reductase family protein [Halapricum hydrolyticum]MCU4716720.1 geranylgeranyl reductase family protein [Halapricum hydrolyticum]MCU4725675.1 geranylgeranyl reductase family protein [Halapricum hydrolyticum]